MTVLTISHVTKQLERNGQHFTAIDDVSLKINAGHVLAILGPSGSGKSTLLRLAAGLLKPDSGQILYDNEDLHSIKPKDRRIGMVFQDNVLVPHWQARESVGFFLKLRKRERELPERVKRISQITGIGIEHLLDRMPSQLSGGERQRVAVARALARDARILFFDEPFANIDAQLRAEARVQLRRLLNEFAVTSLFVTHDQMEAIALSHHIAVMREGRLEQIGTYRQLYDTPANVFVATFIGTPTMNLFTGYVHDGRWHGTHFGDFPIRADLPNQTRVALGIRAEYIYIVDDAGVVAIVREVTPFFAAREQWILVRAGKEEWTIKVPLEMSLEVGTSVHCVFDPEGIHYFDMQTGKRIG